MQKKYCETHSKSIELANELAVYMYSLNGPKDVVRFLDSYCEQSPYVAHRWQRWEAACYAMLLNAHLKKISGELGEHERLIGKIQEKDFEPFPSIRGIPFDDFIEANRNLPEWGPLTHHEKCQILAQGYLCFLYAMYIGSTKWDDLRGREDDIERELTPLLEKLQKLILENDN